MSLSSEKCPLCASAKAVDFYRDRWRNYLKCPQCELIFVPKRYHLSKEEEKARYDLHQNDAGDEGYRNFLMGIATPLIERLSKGSRGLDFGSGPEPVLTMILNENGFSMKSYDCYYAPDLSLLELRYDFLVCSETIEHFANPRFELERFKKLVKPDGIIAIKTERSSQQADFSKWHYIRDETHILFFSSQTIQWIATHLDLSITYDCGSTTLFQNSPAQP